MFINNKCLVAFNSFSYHKAIAFILQIIFYCRVHLTFPIIRSFIFAFVIVFTYFNIRTPRQAHGPETE